MPNQRDAEFAAQSDNRRVAVGGGLGQPPPKAPEAPPLEAPRSSNADHVTQQPTRGCSRRSRFRMFGCPPLEPSRLQSVPCGYSGCLEANRVLSGGVLYGPRAARAGGARQVRGTVDEQGILAMIKRRPAAAGPPPSDCGACVAEDDEAVRSDAGHGDRRRDRTHRDLMPPTCANGGPGGRARALGPAGLVRGAARMAWDATVAGGCRRIRDH